jgi:hypothetical protein
MALTSGRLTLTLRLRHSVQAPALRINPALLLVSSDSGPVRPPLLILFSGGRSLMAMSLMALETELVVLA